jgi:hypothetical protein
MIADLSVCMSADCRFGRCCSSFSDEVHVGCCPGGMGCPTVSSSKQQQQQQQHSSSNSIVATLHGLGCSASILTPKYVYGLEACMLCQKYVLHMSGSVQWCDKSNVDTLVSAAGMMGHRSESA